MINLWRIPHTRRFCLALLLMGTLLLSACGTSRYKGSKGSSTKGYAVAQTAKSQIGKKYRYGGESPKKGFDCSGLIWWAYNKHGLEVPRVTSDQAKAGSSISKSRAKPGDIVVFRMSKRSTALHTGIYVGDNSFVHSPSSGSRVRVESLNSYWEPKLRTVRRIVK